MTQALQSGWTLVAASNNDAILSKTLLESPAINAQCQLIVRKGFCSAGLAYNSGLQDAGNDIVVFAHQDVYLPAVWVADLQRALDYLAGRDPNWAVLGVFGVVRGTNRRTGYCYSTGLQRTLGQAFVTPVPAQSLDELLLVVRKSSGLRFDEALPHFHLYGADICLQARMLGMSSYIIPAFCIHNSIGLRYLSLEFWRSYLYLRKKWRAELPVVTCCTKITRSGWPIVHHILSRTRDHMSLSVKIGGRSSNPAALYQMLQLTESVRERQ